MLDSSSFITSKKSAKHHLQLISEVGENVLCHEGFEVFNGHEYIKIGNNVSLVNVLLNASENGRITIEDFVFFGHNVQVIARTHDYYETNLLRQGSTIDSPIHIKEGAWIASGAIILSGVTIGQNSVVGAGSVVTKNVPDNSLAVGNPASVIKKIAIKECRMREMDEETVLRFFRNKTINAEQKEVLDFIKKHGLHSYPYLFDLCRKEDEIEVFDDLEKNLKYVIVEKKRLYGKKGWTNEYFRGLVACLVNAEQHVDSPHRYLSDNFNVNVGDTVIDIGAAEGIFALQIIDIANKVYIIECDNEWIEPLKCTFEPYKDKVIILNKYVSDVNNDKNITIDQLVADEDIIVDFIKADTEGAEESILLGAHNTLSRTKNIKLAIASYHKANDEEVLSSICKKHSFCVSFSKGYMIPLGEEFFTPPFLKRGILRAKRGQFHEDGTKNIKHMKFKYNKPFLESLREKVVGTLKTKPRLYVLCRLFYRKFKSLK